MFPSANYFRDIQCPFFSRVSCPRPHCHFKHVQASSINIPPGSFAFASPSSNDITLPRCQRNLEQTDQSALVGIGNDDDDRSTLDRFLVDLPEHTLAKLDNRVCQCAQCVSTTHSNAHSEQYGNNREIDASDQHDRCTIATAPDDGTCDDGRSARIPTHTYC